MIFVLLCFGWICFTHLWNFVLGYGILYLNMHFNPNMKCCTCVQNFRPSYKMLCLGMKFWPSCENLCLSMKVHSRLWNFVS
jgi:hypothetical protein